MENVGIFYGHLVYFMVIWYILRPFGTFHGHLVYFSCFGMLHQEKSGNPASRIALSARINPTTSDFTTTTLALYIVG
jgi:hypothetical protein